MVRLHQPLPTIRAVKSIMTAVLTTTFTVETQACTVVTQAIAVVTEPKTSAKASIGAASQAENVLI
jgi:hypothetical protein